MIKAIKKSSVKKIPAKKKAVRIRPLKLSEVELNVTSECCENSSLVLSHAYESANALLKAYDLAREQRGRPRGMTTDQEQDLLRAMLVMAAAGLDAMSKQLIRDSLTRLLDKSGQALNTFEKFIARKLGEESKGQVKETANKFLARVLSRPSPQNQLIEEYIQDLTKGSLQSTDALFQVAAALGIDPRQAEIEPDSLTAIFKSRNKIIHELDIDLTAHRRNRRVRQQTQMIRDANTLLKISANILSLVDRKVSE